MEVVFLVAAIKKRKGNTGWVFSSMALEGSCTGQTESIRGAKVQLFSRAFVGASLLCVV
jgi:hypothetical protein